MPDARTSPTSFFSCRHHRKAFARQITLRQLKHRNIVVYHQYQRCATLRRCATAQSGSLPMPSFDVVSEIDMQELKNAVDQATREVGTRFDFKDTDSSLELTDTTITLRSVTEERLKALRQVLEERLVKREVSLKVLDLGKVEEATKGTARQVITLKAGIGADKAREINKFIKEAGPKGIQSQTQGDTLRVTGKKRDDLQAAIAALKGHDFELPLQFKNFRD